METAPEVVNMGWAARTFTPQGCRDRLCFLEPRSIGIQRTEVIDNLKGHAGL